MLIFGLNIGTCSEINSNSLAHDLFSIEYTANSNSGVFVEERDDYSGEGFKWCPGVDGRGGVDEFADGLKIVCAEDYGVAEVGDYESV